MELYTILFVLGIILVIFSNIVGLVSARNYNSKKPFQKLFKLSMGLSKWGLVVILLGILVVILKII